MEDCWCEVGMINQIRNIICPIQKFQRKKSKVQKQYDALLARN